MARVPILHGGYLGILRQLIRLRPDAVIAQHGTAVSALAYQWLCPRGRRPLLAAYFADYIKDSWWVPLLRGGASSLDAYIDVCDLRLSWRAEDWPKLPPARFVIRNAPPRSTAAMVDPHSGPARVLFTGRDSGAAMRTDLLLRFVEQLCRSGHRVDWFLPGAESERTAIRDRVGSSGLQVRAPIDKAALSAAMPSYDVGILWTPITAAENLGTRSNYVSAASNKLGEYLAAGLAIAHTGNPGLRFLPDSVGFTLDPFAPEASAERLDPLLRDRPQLDARRADALRFHIDSLNAETQCKAFADWLCKALGQSGEQPVS